MHLETLADPDNADSAKYYIVNGTTTYTFRPQSLSSGNRYFNPTGGDKPFYHATGGDCNNMGLVGVYSDANDGGSKWHLEPAIFDAPDITLDISTNKFTIADVNSLPSGYTIRYTTGDGSQDPPTATTGDEYTEPVSVLSTTTVKAVVVRYGIVLTEVASEEIIPFSLAQPTFEITCDNKLEIICSNLPDGGQIRYTFTTDGSTPAVPTSSSTLYEEPIELASGDKVKAKAFYGLLESEVSEVHTHSFTHTNAPTIETTSATEVTITGPSGSTIYYTTNGVDPVIGAPGVTSGLSPVIVDFGGDMTEFRAIAKATSLEVSCVVRLVTMGNPVVTIEEDACTETSPRRNVIVIPLPSDGSTVWYAVTAGDNSAAPDIDSLPNPYSQYTGDVVLDDLDGTNTYYTVHAYAKSSDELFVSSITSVSHEMKTGGKPELTPPVGSSPVVVISGGVFGDVAVCSATGVAAQNIPIASDGTAEYTITPEATGMLTVVFKHGDWQPSCEATYTLPGAPETPTWSQDCANLLSLHCATPMADIHYTTNDTEPTLESLTYVAGCLDAISVGTIIRAKAFIGFRASGELSFTYNPTHSTAPQFFVEGSLVTISVPNHPEATIYYELSTNGDQTMPSEPAEATTSSTQYNSAYTLTGITIFSAIAVYDGLEPSCPVRAVTREGYSINSASDLSKLSTYSDKYFFVFNDIDASDYSTTVEKFTGIIEGNNHTISNLTNPLFDTVTDGVIHDLTLADVIVNVTGTDADAGAFARVANGDTRIYNCGIIGSNSSVSGTRYVGGLVGLLDGDARVINCFSYADINGGTHRAGIVGYNNVATKSSDIAAGNGTMVMNCMFYGDINTDGTPTPTIYPVYGGKNIHNRRDGNNDTGLNNYCYFYYHGDYVNHINDDDYHGSLGAEERFLNRFEFFRQTLNSTRNMAAYYISGDATETELVAKWVLDKSIAPYPILKAPGYYPSIINHDAEHAVPIDPDIEHYNEGRKLGTLTVYIQKGTGGAVFNNGDASITTSPLTLNITDKDFDHDDYTSDYYDFNYKKVQLPYYNQVGEGNYTNNRVVTGWKIVKINGSDTGTGNFTTATHNYPDWNFVDRACSNKDLYSVSGRVFNQGAYWEVPDNVTSITIEPYWAKAVYLSDANYDVTYDGVNGKYAVTVAGTCPTTFNNGQTVYNTVTGTNSAMANLNPSSTHTVYDYAVVLVGNFHQCVNDAIVKDNTPVTFMSADTDGDCEPDNTLFYYHSARRRVSPIRFDFLNIPGVGMVKRTWNSSFNPQPGIFKPYGWFEVTNTVLLRCGQFEYCDGTAQSQEKINNAPLILQGGIYEQFVSSKNKDAPDLTPYLLIGGNAWFKNFANGCHTGADTKTHNMPINVTGGDYENFYLSGIYRPSCPSNGENAECYMDGGRFGEVAGAGMQEIGGTVTWCINAADIEKFFGGGINAAKPITDSVTTTISNSRVTEFYGGPKFGDMKTGKTVTTTATNCHFGLFFGAGHGGTAYNKKGVVDATLPNTQNTAPWDSYVNSYYKRQYESSNSGISTNYEYEYILHSDGSQTVARFFVNYASLSLASTKDVYTNLTDCTIGTFYGGGRLGAVDGNVNSTLTDCIVEGDVFGSGFSAEAPSLMVMDVGHFGVAPQYNRRAGVFNDAEVTFPDETQYLWKHANTVTTGHEFEDDGDNHYILTTENLDNLGAVLGNTTLTINGNRTEVWGDVYGGGALSSTNTGKKIQVNINEGVFGEAGAATGGNIYGGGMGNAQNAVTEGEVELNIGNSAQSANSVVINGSVYGCNNANGSPKDNVTVNIYKTKHNSSNVVLGSDYAIYQVFGGGNQAHYTPTSSDKKTTVHVHNCDNTIEYVYGGGNAANVGVEDGITSGTDVIIDGGHMDWIFGGGNGAGDTNPGANIFGDVTVSYHAGKVEHLFGGSNEKGSISGTKTVTVLGDGSCDPKEISELYGGNNKADATGDISLTMACTDNPCKIDYLFGGSRQANITGNVELNVYGGEYDYVFGGNNISGVIGGNVTLNLYGGTIHEAAFGGNKGGGSIDGDITVNVNDAEDPDCPLVVKDVFGAGDQAEYTAPTGEGARDFNPIVNINHIRSGQSITGNVYGGGNGDPDDDTQKPGMVTGHPKVIIGDVAASHETYIANIGGNVYGGGNAAKVVGTTNVLMQKANSEVGQDIYGGGNLAHVSGATTVNVTGGTVTGDVYGGGALANVGGSNVILDGGMVHDIYGGGLGRTTPEPAIAAQVTGAVQVTVNGGTVTGSVYGCNNVNGAPQSTVNVDINDTDHPSSGFALGNVFGGGNAANYAGTPVVKVHNCDNSIGYVYGGGNAASVAATDVTIYGGNTIGNVFGGCYGANVNGNTNVKIYGGTIGAVYGGNNQSGSITGNMNVTVNKQTEEGHLSCEMHITEVYGGGNKAASQVGNIAIHCTGTGATEGIEYVYGGANQADINGNIELTIDEGRIGNVFGGNNNSGSISGAITVTIEKKASSCVWEIGNVFGGGNLAQYSGTPLVYIKNGTVANVYGGGNGDPDDSSQEPGQVTGTNVTIGDNTVNDYCAIITGNVYGGGNAAKVSGNTLVTYNDNNASSTVGNLFGGGNAAGVTGTATVNMTLGTVTTGIYGGCNSEGNVEGKITVNVTGGTLGSQTNLNSYTTADVFGGGFGASTSTSGNVEVNINGSGVNIYGDVYGGSALGDVNTSVGNTTIVNILDGTLHSVTDNSTGFPVYHGGNVYGGGLGDATHAPVENGIVIVNIGTGTPDPVNPFTVLPTGVSGDATIGGNVYGCNNTAGSPQDNVIVNVFKTAHTDGSDGNSTQGTGFAIANVFGGGNEADYAPIASGKKATVNVYTCDNTIRRVFGGGNAAATPPVETNIQGGHIQQVFGGGNGERGVDYAADINGNVYLNIHGGNVEQFFGGSNQNGHIDGSIYTDVTSDGPCGGMVINEFFCGSNEVDIIGDVITTLTCSENMTVTNLYGGCNQANITGNVVLNIEGGTYTNVFGGSKGRLSGTNSPEDPGKSADITGNVTLNLKGGTIENAFGGSNVNGNIGGTITVNVVDVEDPFCPLYVTNIYGGSNLTDYEPTYDPAPGTERITPIVNVVHAKNGISGNVYGGSKGEEGVTTNVLSNPLVNIGYDATAMNTYIPSSYVSGYSTLLASPRAIIAGSVFGGGDAAKVTGNTAIYLRNRAKVFGNVYGGGNEGVVTGDTKVIVNGDNQ